MKGKIVLDGTIFPFYVSKDAAVLGDGGDVLVAA
jgi:hypothetical protein